jgi:hypothetical protein
VTQATGSSTRRFKPYPANKDSAVEWVGKITAGWHVKPLKRAVALKPDVLPEETAPDSTFWYVYKYTTPKPLEEIQIEIKTLEPEILSMMRGIVG